MDFRKTFIVKEKTIVQDIHTRIDDTTHVFYKKTETLRPLGWIILPFAYLIQGFIEGFPEATKDYIKIIKDKGRVFSGGFTHRTKEKFVETYGEKTINEYEGNKEN